MPEPLAVAYGATATPVSPWEWRASEKGRKGVPAER
jgi:hypothetical protein